MGALISQSQRLVVKIGSALLVDEQGLRREWLEGLILDIARLAQNHVEVLLVSSGSIALGRQELRFPHEHLSLDESQAAAAVGQIALAQAYREALSSSGLKAAQVLLTSQDGEDRRRYLNTQSTINRLLKMGVVPIVNENDTVATDEIRFGDNDRLAAQIAAMTGADCLVLLSDVDGLYTKNPNLHDDAEHLPLIEAITPEIEAMAIGKGSRFSKGGMQTKLQAAQIAMKAGVKMAIGIGDCNQPLKAIDEGARVSWFISPTNPSHARKNWIMSMKTRGKIHVDKGAYDALKNGSSLLAAGCSAVMGAFHRGDAVEIVYDHAVFAHGLINYDHDEAHIIAGKKSQEIEPLLGYVGRGAMIHRDNLAMLI